MPLGATFGANRHTGYVSLRCIILVFAIHAFIVCSIYCCVNILKHMVGIVHIGRCCVYWLVLCVLVRSHPIGNALLGLRQFHLVLGPHNGTALLGLRQIDLSLV